MATLALWLDNRNKNTKKFPVVLRISHQQKTKYISMGYKVSIEEWDIDNLKIQKPFPNSGRANAVIGMKKAIADKFVTEVDKASLKKYNVNDIVLKIESLMQEAQNPITERIEARISVSKFGASIVERMKKAKREGYAISIESCLGGSAGHIDHRLPV